MTIDPRLHRIVAAQPYPLLFATISGAYLDGFPSPDLDSGQPRQMEALENDRARRGWPWQDTGVVETV